MHRDEDGTAKRRIPDREIARAVASLTPRQWEIAELLTEGLTNGEISDRLVLSRGTVSNHVEHILRRLGARNRVQAACGSRCRAGRLTTRATPPRRGWPLGAGLESGAVPGLAFARTILSG
jgi:DNA-binding CsgD family transcriptional regulator